MMTVKHQSDCYRTVNGVRWPNLCDLMGEQEETALRSVRAAGYRVKVRAHPDGFRRAFVHPDDLRQASGVFNEASEALQ